MFQFPFFKRALRILHKEPFGRQAERLVDGLRDFLRVAEK
jgi:hypothetical protein